MTYVELKKIQKGMKITNIVLGKLAGFNPDYLSRLKHREIPASIITILELLEQLPLEQRAGYIARKLEEA